MSAVLLIGDRQGGKSTTCRRLAEVACARGLTLAGLIAPAVEAAGRCVGYTVVDLATGHATQLANLSGPGVERVGRFHFLTEGLALGREALARAVAQPCELTIVDEVGPLELAGGGWGRYLDPLASGPGLVLFTLRRDLAGAVARRWSVPPPRICDVRAGADAIFATVMRLVAT